MMLTKINWFSVVEKFVLVCKTISQVQNVPTVNSIEYFVLIFRRKMMLTKSIDFQWKMFPWFSIQNHNFKNIAKSIEKCLWSTNMNSWKCLDRVFNTKNDSIKSIAKSIEIVISIWHINDKNLWDFNNENLWDINEENRIDFHQKNHVFKTIWISNWNICIDFPHKK